ncbi:MAG: choice-of-anchor D domain-containing protein, partial [Urechidicola sp.]|nr:choice-of-anchor D domain-containing protein [Urechidicola sp.]
MVIKLLKNKNFLFSLFSLFFSVIVYSQYCTSTGLTNDTGTTLVQFNSINNSSASNLGYMDYTASQSTSVMQGSSHQIYLNVNTFGNWTSHALVWIDWNQNNLFDDGSYDLGTATNVTDGATTLSGLSITVPMTATLGTTRMRVTSKYNVDPTSCETGIDGEVEDYAIVVTANVPAPEINILGNGVSIVSGDITPSSTDDTDFGSTSLGVTVSKTFTIQNTGNLDLIISNISLSNSIDFSITGIPYSSPVSASSSTTFEITYNSVTGGETSSTVTINNNDSDESSYQFDILGESDCPIISLSGSVSTPESCDGCNDITITVGLPTGGTAPYEYSVDGKNWSSSNLFTELSSGSFTVYAKDVNGCLGQERITSYISFAQGACVIDMGITPQTVNNGLVPYGLVYDLVQNYDIPVYWIINPDKTFVNASTIVNQKDISISGTTTRLGSTPVNTDLKAGPFLIPAEFIDDAYTVIEQWITDNSGLTVYWNLDAISDAPVNGIINSLANVVIYPEGGDVNAETDIEEAFFVPAGIPTSAYRRGFISDLNGCDEIYVLSHHTDPEDNWSQQDVDDLYDYVIDGGNVWMGCHDVSISESLLTTSDGNQLNFLSESGLIPYYDINNVSTNFPYLSAFASGNTIQNHTTGFTSNNVLYNLTSAGNPMMQFMEEVHDAMDGNSEHVFVPFTDGWRSTTLAAIYDSNHDDIPSRSPGEAAVVAYGPAYGNKNYGTILYQGSHINAQNNGSVAEYVGERRIFGNYLLESAIKYAKDAGSDQSFALETCGAISTTLDAEEPINDSGIWTIVSGTGGSFEDDTNPKTEFYGQESETYILKWSVSCYEDTVEIKFVTACSTIDFDGKDDNITFKDNFNDFGDFSIEIWVKSEETNGEIQTLFSKRNGKDSSTGYDLRLVNNIISFNWNKTGTLSSPYPISTNRWYHVAVTFANGVYTLFIDGVEVNTGSGSSPATTKSTVDCLLGAMDQVTSSPFEPINHFNGWLDELRIWDVELTVDQIRNMMNQEIEENGGNVRGSIIPMDIDGLLWSNLDGYYQMNQSTDVSEGQMQATSGFALGRLRNSDTFQEESAPLPYITIKDGDWSDKTGTTPWLYCNSVWDTPNSIGIDGSTKIDWNIVVINKNTIEVDQNMKVLALISFSDALITDEEIIDSELTIGGNGGSYELNISKYLKLDGKIDLENESQLIQGEGSWLDVDSSGYIERDQQGTENSYTYNYWSSPVSKRSVSNNNVAYNLSNILRDGSDALNPSTINFGYSWQHADGALSNPRKLATYWMWKFVNSGNDYNNWQWIGNSNNLNVTEGYTMKGTSGSSAVSNEQNYTFRGKPNNVTNGATELVHTSFPGTFDANGNPFITLAGNPFPSALDADQFILDNTGSGTDAITGTLYFWEHWSNNTHYLSEYQGGYAAYTLAGGTAAISHPDIDQGGSGTKPAPGQYIPVGQGFFVYQNYDDDGFGNLSNPASGNVVFKNGQRVFQIEDSNSESTFTRNASTDTPRDQTPELEDDENIKQRIWLQFEAPSGFKRQVLAAFLNGATDSVDRGYDARLIDQLPSDAYFAQQNKKFGIIAFGEFSNDREIPIVVVINEEDNGGVQKMTLDKIENIGSSIGIYIKDNLTGLTTDLRSED